MRLRSQAKVQAECLVEFMQQLEVQVPHEGPDAFDIDRADLLSVGLRRPVQARYTGGEGTPGRDEPGPRWR